MLWNNPVILKEFLQAARQIRTYIVRAALPALAALLMTIPLMQTLRWAGQDWRAISRIARTLFETTAWFELFAFAFMAFGFGMMTLREEWQRRTMEVLCATPLSRFQIVYGKFFAVIARLVMTALALAPVMAVWLHMGRIPRPILLGTFGVILSTMFLMGALALLQGAMYRPGKNSWANMIGLVLPYFLGLTLIKIASGWKEPITHAALPVLALPQVMSGAGKGACTAAGFAWLSAGVNTGVAALALGLTPWFFNRSYTRHVASGPKRSWWRKAARFLGGTRPAFGEPRPYGLRRFAGLAAVVLVSLLLVPRLSSHDYSTPYLISSGAILFFLVAEVRLFRNAVTANPFAWQELGAPTGFVRRAVWLVYAVAVIIAIVAGAADHGKPFDAFDEDEFWWGMLILGLFTIGLVSLFYGACVFAGEKSRRRAEGLLLTGVPPWRFYAAKILALYEALRYSLFSIVLLISLLARMGEFRHVDGNEMVIFIALMGQGLVFGPAMAAMVGMAFSALSKSPVRACLALLGAGLWGFLIFWALMLLEGLRIRVNDTAGGLAAGLLVLSAIVAFAGKGMRPWRLALLLALEFFAVIMALIACDRWFSGDMEENMMALLGSGLVWLLCLGWLRVGLRTFEQGMTAG